MCVYIVYIYIYRFIYTIYIYIYIYSAYKFRSMAYVPFFIKSFVLTSSRYLAQYILKILYCLLILLLKRALVRHETFLMICVT